MPIGDKQKLITDLVGKALDEDYRCQKFPWFINQHQLSHFKDHYQVIDKVFKDLNGNDHQKKVLQLQPDAYFGGKWNFLFEFDEFQHFSSARLQTLSHYPSNLKLNFCAEDWKRWCVSHAHKADKYRFNKTTTDFSFYGGRTSQRAYLDCFRDFLPLNHGLNPTVRISEFEVVDITVTNAVNLDKIKRLLEKKIKHIVH